MTDLTQLALALAPQGGKGWGLPLDASRDGHHIDWLLQITAVFTLILFVIMCVWMVWAARKHNSSHVADYDHGDSKPGKDRQNAPGRERPDQTPKTA